MEQMLVEIMSEQHRTTLAEALSVDFAYEVEELGRFRVNAYQHVGGLAAVLRLISGNVPSLDSLGLPPAIKANSTQPKGLTLVTGPTGSGKSTTLAAMIDHINVTRKSHIITIEDPIEFVHEFKGSVISQREIHVHSPSFSDALRDAVREDPDVILVGELRDLETISLALTAAEMGVQVLGTLHTSGASRTIDRILNVFPAGRQEQIRAMLADGLRMIVSQQLVRTEDGNKRVAVNEILINTQAVSSMIRTGNSHKVESAIQVGSQIGMQSLDAKLKELVQNGTISGEEAHRHAIDKSKFEHLLITREAA
jgi:twitching motility protein PilT